MRLYFLCFFLTFTSVSFGQEVPVLKPSKIVELDFSAEFIKNFNSEQSFANCEKVYEKMKVKGYQLTKADEKILSLCEETMESPWEIIGGGCSWYCLGGGDSVIASSQLSNQGKNNYNPKNAHDLSYETAWVEGAKGDGTGEYLIYHFTETTNPIDDIILVNGYVKSQQTWEYNARIKKLKVYLDGKPYAVLELEDKCAQQTFHIERIIFWLQGNRTIKFEIMEVYPGKKYEDAAITEIYFDGPSH